MGADEANSKQLSKVYKFAVHVNTVAPLEP